MSIKGYKCPNCGGNLVFSSDRQKLHCPSCDTEIDMKTYQEYVDVVKSAEEKGDTYDWGEEESQNSGEWSVREEDGKKIYTCPSCGGEIDAHTTTAATTCPYCDSPVILPGQISGEFHPDLIIPFRLDQEAAKKAYKTFCQGKPLLPKAFQSDQRIQEITGIYVPFWLFSCEAEGSVNYDAQRIRKWRDSSFEYTKTDFYLVTSEGKVDFDYVPVDGSIVMDDAYMESIEPYDMEMAIPFDEGYLSGYEAQKYDVTKEESRKRAEDRIKTSFDELLDQSVNRGRYSIVIPRNSRIGCTKGKVQYALMPVWVIKVKYKDTIYQFAMNGQTGKLAGELPVDKGVFWKYAFGIFAGSSVIVYLLLLVLLYIL